MTGKIRVLYVDDEPGLLEIAQIFLEQTGEFAVDTATSAQDAIAGPAIRSCDAIVSDYQMPGMDGIALLKAVREQLGGIPFILFTGRGREEVVIDAINNGADFYLQKGGDPRAQFAELAHKIRQAVKRRRAEDELILLKTSVDQAYDEVFWLDFDGTILYVNESACRTTGYSRDELLGMKITSLDPDFSPEVWAESVADLRERKNQFIRTRHRRKDGRILNVEVMTIYFQKEGREYSFAFVRDITERSRIEEDLKESETNYRELADLLPLMVFELDPEFRVTYANRQACDTMGITGKDLEGGITALSFINPSEHGMVMENTRKILDGGPPEPHEYTALRKDGSAFPVIIHAAPMYRDNRVAGYRGVIVDISAQKAMDDGLRESESRFRTIFENSPTPIAINSLPDNAFLAVNRAFLDASGYTEAEVIGKNPVEMGLLSLGEAAKLISQRIFRGKIENVPLALTAKEGRKVHVIFSTMPAMIGNQPATVTVTAEVTSLKRVEEELIRKNVELTAANEGLTKATEELRRNYDELARKEQVLRESEENFRALVELSLDGIFITDFSGNLLFANQAAGLIIDIPEYKNLTGNRNVMEFVAEESRADVLRDFSKVSGGTDAYLVTYKLITQTKREIWVECVGKKIPFNDTPAILVSMRDVTERNKAEAAIRESESRFSSVFRDSPVAMTLVSAEDGTFVDVNNTFLANTGYSRNEVIGRTAGGLEIFPDDDGYKHFVSSLRERQAVRGMELRCRIKSGVIRTCLFSSAVIPMGGEPLILSTVEDVTERRVTESAIQAIVRSMVGTTGFNSLRNITENISSWLSADCVMVGEIEPDNQTVSVLSMLLDGKDIHGYTYTLRGTPCENVAQKGYCLYPDNAPALFPESRDIVDMNMQSYIGTPLRDSRGAVIGILCALSRSPLRPSHTVREILEVIAVKASAEIERIRIERELRKSRQMLAEAMDLAHLVSWEYDVATGMFAFDDRFYALYGTTAEREGGTRMSVGTYAREFIHPDEQGIVFEEVEKARQATDPGYVSRREHRIVRRDGTIRHIAVTIGITKDEQGRTIKTHGANQDITERKRIEEAIRRANIQLNLLSKITRHDIINKISIILGYIRVAEMKYPDPALAGLLRKIEDNIGMIRSQIEFTRVYRDLGTHEPQWLSLSDVLSRLNVPAGISLATDTDGVTVLADPLLERVFFNLLDNSVRHGERVTEIHVSSHRADGGLVVVWEDNGIGIPNIEKEQIFEQGFGKNTGLGLFLAREILSLTGISIHETGEAGKGARFEIAVPKDLYRTVAPVA